MAAPVDSGDDESVDVPFSPSVRLPPEPAVDVGDTFSVASIEAFLKASSVLAPVELRIVSKEVLLQE